MSAYKPKSDIIKDLFKKDDPSDPEAQEIGFFPKVLGFETFDPNPKFDWSNRKSSVKDMPLWKTIVPERVPQLSGSLPDVITKLIQTTWKFAEPGAGAGRGHLIIGNRPKVGRRTPGNHVAETMSPTYSPQVRPVREAVPTLMGDGGAAIAADWKVFEHIDRTHAVTFRGDTRPPSNVIQKCDGFHPPNARTDRAYLEGAIFDAFADYLTRRYQRPLTQQSFLRALDSAVPTPDDRRMLVDYMMWRKITEGESMHLGRMTENECLKGYISTSRSIDSSINFGTSRGAKPGWLYVTVVHDGFVVPHDQFGRVVWGQAEGEIAQWGPIPGHRIVGFRRLTNSPKNQPVGPIYMRQIFRLQQPKAFEEVCNIMSGKGP